jgi:hypothetical protein
MSGKFPAVSTPPWFQLSERGAKPGDHKGRPYKIALGGTLIALVGATLVVARFAHHVPLAGGPIPSRADYLSSFSLATWAHSSNTLK